MYKNLLITVVAIVTISWVAPQAEQKLKIPRNEVVNRVDPVCGMPLHKADIEDTTLYKGKIIGFCSHKCKMAFAANPAKYRVTEK